MGSYIQDTSAQDVVIQPASFLSKSKIYALAIVVFLLFLIVFIYRQFSGVIYADFVVDRSEVRISEVRFGDLIREVSAQGRVIAANSPTLFSPEQGYIDLKVKEGEKVVRGQLLGTVISPSLNELMAQEESALLRLKLSAQRGEIDTKQRKFELQQRVDIARINIKAMAREKRRSEMAFESRLISQIDYEKSADDLSRAELEYQQSQQNNLLEQESLDFNVSTVKLEIENQRLIVQGLERRVRELSILSPVDGVVGNIQVEQRQALEINQPLITVVDLHAFEVEARIPESFADEIAHGMAAVILVNSDKFEGEITGISPEVVNAEVIAHIRFVGEKPKNIRQNQRLSTRILLQNKPNVLLVDRGDFFSNFGGDVFRVRGDKAERIDIKLGESSLQYMEIVSGLEAGDEIIVSRLDVGKNDNEILLSH